MQTEIEQEFGDGVYLFALRLPEIKELQRLCDAGLFTIYGRVLAGRNKLIDPAGNEIVVTAAHQGAAFVEDVYETVRLGLIGGGRGLVNGQEVKVDALRARQLMETYVYGKPVKPTWDLAAATLYALIEGYDPGPKGEPAEAPAQESKATE